MDVPLVYFACHNEDIYFCNMSTLRVLYDGIAMKIMQLGVVSGPLLEPRVS
jgi:hypothetical protein